MVDVEEETAGLIATVEKTRAAHYRDLDPVLVSDILHVQHMFAEDRAEARKRTQKLINAWAAKQPLQEANTDADA